MNNLTKKYAQALFESIKDLKSKKDIEPLLDNFVNILIKENKVSQLPQIISYFDLFWNKNKKIVLAEVVSIQKLNQKDILELKNYIKKRSNSDDVVLEEKIDKNLKGGVVFRFDNKIVDMSIRNKLTKLKNILIC